MAGNVVKCFSSAGFHKRDAAEIFMLFVGDHVVALQTSSDHRNAFVPVTLPNHGGMCVLGGGGHPRYAEAQETYQSTHGNFIQKYCAVAANDSDKLSTLRDNHLQLITTEPEVEVCQGETVSFIFNVTIPANLTPDRMYERTVWSPHKKDHCVIFRNISKCHGAEDFIQRAEISETWSPVSQGGHTQHGKLMFQLNNVSMGDAGYYEGELKTEYHINNVNARLIVKGMPVSCRAHFYS
ncbi:Hypp2704 [Branchiostoma lanceolatum]|uniref:Hypp2704 protein n=1 Tax=Branchiostoma lanceolatum TaxID=7740 RepID=A0A8J9ZWH0_BRALA|nr:Hypp2704 [Branchiostoma lanceolatum]